MDSFMRFRGITLGAREVNLYAIIAREAVFKCSIPAKHYYKVIRAGEALPHEYNVSIHHPYMYVSYMSPEGAELDAGSGGNGASASMNMGKPEPGTLDLFIRGK